MDTSIAAQKRIDTSGIKAGSTLRHKAFGLGIVSFEGSYKKFQFPDTILLGAVSGFVHIQHFQATAGIQQVEPYQMSEHSRKFNGCLSKTEKRRPG